MADGAVRFGKRTNSAKSMSEECIHDTKLTIILGEDLNGRLTRRTHTANHGEVARDVETDDVEGGLCFTGDDENDMASWVVPIGIAASGETELDIENCITCTFT